MKYLKCYEELKSSYKSPKKTTIYSSPEVKISRDKLGLIFNIRYKLNPVSGKYYYCRDINESLALLIYLNSSALRDEEVRKQEIKTAVRQSINPIQVIYFLTGGEEFWHQNYSDFLDHRFKEIYNDESIFLFLRRINKTAEESTHVGELVDKLYKIKDDLEKEKILNRFDL